MKKNLQITLFALIMISTINLTAMDYLIELHETYKKNTNDYIQQSLKGALLNISFLYLCNSSVAEIGYKKTALIALSGALTKNLHNTARSNSANIYKQYFPQVSYCFKSSIIKTTNMLSILYLLEKNPSWLTAGKLMGLNFISQIA